MTDFSGVRVLLFRIGQLTCGAYANAVREILAPSAATPVPGAPSAVSGVVNVRGTLVTVVDARRTFRVAPDEAPGVLVLLDVAGRVIGLVVDEVLDLVTVSADDLSDRGSLPGVDPEVVRAVGRRGRDAFVLLDLEALLGPVFRPEEA